MTPFAHAFVYAIKKTPYAFFAKITLCMYILCAQMHSRSVNALVKEKRNRIEFELTESVYKRAKCERAL